MQVKSLSIFGAIGGPPKPQSPQSTERSDLKEPRYPGPLLISPEIPSFVNGGKRARETPTLLNGEEGEWEEGNRGRGG